ncbi:MAG TPA: hypothetical protein VEH50_02890 [Methylomirabilota bacterium]|nr:hypothetical protein [Methylomirabilota bacterium]
MRDEIRSGHATRERKLAVCAGTASLPANERIELLAILAGDSDEQIRERSANALIEQPVENILNTLAVPDLAPQFFAFCGHYFLEKPGVADALAKHTLCPPELLHVVAPRLSTSGVQFLFDHLELLAGAPGLAAALSHSTSLNAEQRLQLQEIQKNSLEPEAAFAEGAADAEPDREKRTTLLQRLTRMNVVARVQLALKGDKQERSLLIRDPCKVVQRAVLQSPRISEQEIEAFAAISTLSEEVLRQIANNKFLRKNYTITHNLVFNAKTPLDITLHLLPNLTLPDLKGLGMNRNVPDTLRKMAGRLLIQRSVKKNAYED